LFITSDGTLTDSQYVDINVTDTDLPPVLDPIPPQALDEGQHLDLRVTATDADGDAITLSAEQLPLNSAFVDSTGGVGGFTFDPDYTQSGFYQVRFIAQSNTLADTQLVDITVNNVDLPPVLDPLPPQTMDEGTHLDLRVTATDPDGDIITLIAEQLPINSAFVDSTGGVGGFEFDPDYTQSGFYQVRFIAQSNALADTQLVDITVNNVDLPPVMDPLSPQTMDEGTHLDLRVTASDPDGDIITLIAEQLPLNSAFVDSTGGVGGFTFDPDYTQSGFYQVRFIAQSNALADTQLVDITVNHVDLPPVIDPIPPQFIDEGAHLDLRIVSTDFDGDPISLTAEQLPINSAFVDSTGGIGGFTFDPDSTQSGFYQVRFIASSTTLADTQLVDITVGDVDLPPILEPIPPQEVYEGEHLDLRIAASDPDGDAIALTAELMPPNSAFVDSTGGVGGFEFDPDYTQSGLLQVRFIASSNALADTQLADITVFNVNLPPILDPIPTPQNVAEGSILEIRVTTSDPDGNIPALAALNLPTNASFVDSLNGAGGFVFTPDYTQEGPYQVLFISSDGVLSDSQYVDINVTNTNLAPVLDSIPTPQTVAEMSVLSLRITASDPDLTTPLLSMENLPLNAVFVDSLNGAGGFVFSPDYTQSGNYTVLAIASDGDLADSQYVDIVVTDVNAPPEITVVGPQSVTEGDSLIFTVSGADIDGDIPALSFFDGPVNSSFEDSLNGVGLFRFYPDFTQSGFYTVGFVASDGLLADTGYVDITVQEVGNQAPILDPIGPQTVGESETLYVAVSAADPDGSIPQLLTGPLPDNAVFEDSSNGNGLFTFTPDYTQSGIDTVIFIASDGALSDSEFVAITILEAGNQGPVLDPIGPHPL
jgi:hypothetical protein